MGSTSGNMEPDFRNEMHRRIRSSIWKLHKSRYHGEGTCTICRDKCHAIPHLATVYCVYIYSRIQSYILLKLRDLSTVAIWVRSRKSCIARQFLLTLSVPGSWEGPWQCPMIYVPQYFQIYYSSSPFLCVFVCVCVCLFVCVCACVCACVLVMICVIPPRFTPNATHFNPMHFVETV